MAERDEALRIVEGWAWLDDVRDGKEITMWSSEEIEPQTRDEPAVLVIGATADEIRAALKAHRGDTGGTDGQG